MEGFFERLGEALGNVLRFIVDALSGLFGAILGAGAGFLDGLASALGMDRSLIGIAVLVIGILLLVGAFRAFFRRSIVSGVILLLLALWLLGLVIH